MLAEFLADRGDWTHVMPGARACLFSLEEGPHPLPLQLDPLHFETLFCLGGSVTLTRRDGTFLTADAGKVLILTDLSGLTDARVDSPMAGVLVAVDARGARESLEIICNLLGGLTLDTSRVQRWMAGQLLITWTVFPKASRHAGACGSRWNCSICSPPRMNRGRILSRVRCQIGI